VRLLNSYKGFFSRCKNPAFKNKKKGYPKEKKRTFSITFPEYKNGCEIIGNKLWLSKIGNLPIVLHRELPIDTEKIKTVTIKRKPSGKWFASICLDIENKIQQEDKEEIKQSMDLSHPIGIDVGCPNIVNLSNGIQIPNPKYYIKSQKRLKMFQRRVSRKSIKVGKKMFSNKSHNRRKAVRKLARFHEHIDNQRNDLQHKLSLWLTRNFTFFAVEKLTISNMLRNHCLAKSIQDSSWGSLLQKIEYKSKGNMFKNPKTIYSSCKCCLCNNIQENPLYKGLDNYVCETCGNVIQKDWNASINHLKDTLESLGFIIGIIKVNNIYYLEADNKIIQLNQTKSNDTVGNTEITNTLVEKLPLLSYSKNKLASNLIETRNTFGDV
jgi:putative transposase